MRIENIRYRVDWSKFEQGSSFFIPCIDVEEARREIDMVTRRLKLYVITQVVVENGVKGLRVWRD